MKRSTCRMAAVTTAGSLALLLAAAPAATAQEYAAPAPEVVIGGEVVMRIRSGAGGLTPEERADAVRRRLGPILTMPDLQAEDVWVQQREQGRTAAVYVRDRLLITADRNLARANDTTPGRLAEKWANLLREVLPQVEVEVRSPGGD